MQDKTGSTQASGQANCINESAVHPDSKYRERCSFERRGKIMNLFGEYTEFNGPQ